MKIPPLKTADDGLALAKTINPKKEALTIGKLRAFPGCEQYNDEEATEIVQAIDLLTTIIFDCVTYHQYPNTNNLAA